MAGIVLAGGDSSRMGVDKALLRYEGEPLLTRVVACLLEVTECVWVVGPAGRDYPIPPKAGYAVDLYPGDGPLGGLITGLRAAGPGTHVAVACDMPFLNPAVLRHIIGSIGDRDAAAPEVGGRLEPLCAAYHSRCEDTLSREFDRGERSLWRAARTLDLHRISERELRRLDPDLISFRNLNRPEDVPEMIT